MKVFFILVSSLMIQSAFALSVQTTRMGEPVVQRKDFYTLINFALETNSVSPEIASKYVILSNGVIVSPVVAAPCKGFQVGQSSLYQGKVSQIILDIQNPLSGNIDCSAEVQKIINADVVEVSIKTALLGDGSGSDVAPLSFIIRK